MKRTRPFGILIATLLLLVSLLGSGCSSPNTENATASTAETADTTNYDLRIAVLPTLEALPIYYAKQAGIFDSLGITVEILPYTGQFDCDTALLNKAADVCMMDHTRYADYRSKGHAISAQLNIKTRYALVASKDINAKNVRDLNNLTIAISRTSDAEAFAFHAVEASGLKRKDVHYPQINDIWLRASMLTNHQVDAAVLPQIQAILAELNGHRLLNSKNIAPDACMQLVYPSSSTKIDKIMLLAKAYELGETQISKNLSSCRNIFIKEYKISEAKTDSIIKRLR